MDEQPYHERQSRMRCGVHCVNNILQRHAFTPRDFELLEERLGVASRWSLTSLLALGNFDANVLMVALQEQGLQVGWWDARECFTAQSTSTVLRSCVALIVNRRSSSWIPFSGRHWLCIRKVAGVWYNLDSTLRHPVPFASAEAMATFVQTALRDSDGECLLVSPIDVAQ